MTAPELLYANAIAGLLRGVHHVAVGMASPIPATGALLAQELSKGQTRVSILGNPKGAQWTNGGPELFDMAGRGRIGAFFLSGGQIDGSGNINLVGTGDYPQSATRWSGSFGSAYLYFVVPRVILFRWEHSRRTLVEQVDFISAPGRSEPGVHRPGGPVALITNLCVFGFDRAAGRFRLDSIHPGHTLEEIRDNTGFDFDCPEAIPETVEPNTERMALLQGPVATRMRALYPVFAETTFGPSQAA